MIAILTLLVIVTISLLVNRIATVALTFTGLSRDTARFQSRVAFTGAGFTTSESELITTHPVRRRIIMMLMFLGNAGLVTVIATLMTGFVNIEDKKSSVDLSEYSIQMTDDAGNPVPNRTLTFRKVVHTDPDEVRWRDVFLGVTPQQQFVSRMLVLVLGILTLWMVASSRWVDEQTFKIIGGMLKRFTRLDNHDFSGILHLSEGYTVSEIEIGKEHWMVGRNLMTLRLSEEGVQVLGVMRSDKTYIGAPTGQTFVRAGDTVIVYGQADHLDELVNREQTAEGEAAHGRRVAEHLADRQQTEQEERALLRDRTSA